MFHGQTDGRKCVLMTTKQNRSGMINEKGKDTGNMERMRARDKYGDQE